MNIKKLAVAMTTAAMVTLPLVACSSASGAQDDCALMGAYTASTGSAYLGTPTKIASGDVVELKPKVNASTTFKLCEESETPNNLYSFLISSPQGDLIVTSTDTAAGGDVTLALLGTGQRKYQRWTLTVVNGQEEWTNVGTGLTLRVRNGGPKPYQTVTTGKMPTLWTGSGSGLTI